jgi:hypothetical protein
MVEVGTIDHLDSGSVHPSIKAVTIGGGEVH